MLETGRMFEVGEAPAGEGNRYRFAQVSDFDKGTLTKDIRFKRKDVDGAGTAA